MVFRGSEANHTHANLWRVGDKVLSTQAPRQRSIACAALKHNVSVAANIFVTLQNGTRRIMQIVCVQLLY
jgi:hypothetical protein